MSTRFERGKVTIPIHALLQKPILHYRHVQSEKAAVKFPDKLLRRWRQIMLFDEKLWEGELPWYEAAVLWLLQLGTVPRHVAIMPDGNRRYSRRTGTELLHTYIFGTRLYERVCRWCLSTGARCVTTFLLATRHMQRSAFERNALLTGVVDTWMEAMQTLNRVASLGLELRTVGPIDLLPVEVMHKLAALEVATSGGIRRCHPVTFTIDGTKTQTVQIALDMAKASKVGIIHNEDITEDLIDDALSLVECSQVDLLLRCAGPRFSDFVVAQCSYAYLHMEPKLWEDFRFWDWIWTVVLYQLNWPSIAAVNDRHAQMLKSKRRTRSAVQEFRQRKFLVGLECRKMAYRAELSEGFPCPE